MKKLTLSALLFMICSTAYAKFPQEFQGKWIASYMGYDGSGIDLSDFTHEQRQSLCESRYNLETEDVFHLWDLNITTNEASFSGHESSFSFNINKNAKQTDTEISGKARVSFYDHSDEVKRVDQFRFTLLEPEHLQFSLEKSLDGEMTAYRCE